MYHHSLIREVNAFTRARVANLFREFDRTFPSLAGESERISVCVSERALRVLYPSVAHCGARCLIATKPSLAQASGQGIRPVSADSATAPDVVDDWIISHAYRVAERAVIGIRVALERLSVHHRQVLRSDPAAQLLDDIRFLGMETHNLGLTPLQFSHGNSTSVVYKPTCVQMQALFHSLCQHGLRGPTVLSHYCPPVLASGCGYGFVEYVTVRKTLKSPSALARYYRRIGQLVAICYALNATDMHHENLLVVGSQPVLIDFETMIYRYPKMFDRIDITSTGLVQPARKSTKATSGIQGGLNVSLIEPVLYGSDSTYARVAYRKVGNYLDNRPLDASGNASNPYHYQKEIIAGMSTMYELVAKRRKQIVETIQRTVECHEHRIRHILRFTSYYLLHILHLYQPLPQDESATRRFRYLTRLKTDESAAEPLSDGILDAEIRDIANGDVPYFYSEARHHDLMHCRYGTIARQYFSTSAVDQVMQRMDSLSARHLKEQTELLRLSLELHKSSSKAQPDLIGPGTFA